MFWKKSKANLPKPGIVEIEAQDCFGPNHRFSGFDKATVNRLSVASYDQLHIFVKTPQFLLENFYPTNPNTQVHIWGGENIIVQDCKFNYLSANAAESADINNSNIQIAQFSNAQNLSFKKISSLTTFTCPNATELRINSANVQPGGDIPKLATLYGYDAPAMAAAPDLTTPRKFGNLYFSPELPYTFDKIIAYNDDTGCFIKGNKKFEGFNQQDPENVLIQQAQDYLLEEMHVHGREILFNADQIIEKFVTNIHAVRTTEPYPSLCTIRHYHN